MGLEREVPNGEWRAACKGYLSVYLWLDEALTSTGARRRSQGSCGFLNARQTEEIDSVSVHSLGWL